MVIVRRFDGVSGTKLTALDRLHPLLTIPDLVKYAKLFQKELIAALHNQRSSLPAILNPIYKLPPNPGFGVAVAIGGTNGYVSVFKILKKGTIKFLNRKPFFLAKKTTKDNLFHLITQNILAVAGLRKKVLPIGIGFAYPLKPLIHHKFIDGELLYMSKGRNIEGLVGKKIGQEYHKFLKDKYKIDTTVAVANDAICLLLGGDGIEVAGVVGTGLNFAYWDNRQSIAPIKLSELANFSQREVAVNIESKNFDKIKGTPLRDIVDEVSTDAGYSLAEKEVSGAYLHQIFNTGKDRLLGKNFATLSSTDQLNDILSFAGYTPGRSHSATPSRWPNGLLEGELEPARLFAERILHRSAQIVAIQLAGILYKIGKTKGIVSVIMEGGVFWKARNYPALVNLYLNMILPEAIPSFARLFGSSRRGIAILARNSA